MTQRRLALLGFGHVAEHGHLPAWLQRRDFRIVALADPRPERRARAHTLLPEAALYDDPDILFEREDVDVVDIATPPFSHEPLSLKSAAAGCHILCEKPLTTSSDEFESVRRAAGAADVALYTVHNWKQAPQYERLASLLDGAAIGHLRKIRLQTVRSGRSASVGADWRVDAGQSGGGILVDHGWHCFYLLLGMARAPARRIRATVEKRRYMDIDVEDTASCEIDFDSLRGEIFLTWAGDRRRTRWELTGTNGAVVLEDDYGEIRRGGDVTPLTFDRSLSAGSHHADWFAAVIDDFVREIDDRARRGSNLLEAERCLMLTSAAYASSACGGVPQDLQEPHYTQELAEVV
jgi:predicted dehydrogenase